MRIDHIAYQRATRVAGFGFLLQAGTGIAMLLFGLIFNDSTLKFGSFYVLTGLLVWVGLLVIFYQHAQERLEALEEDELAISRAGVGSVFDLDNEELHVAARRLRLMHKWLMPGISLLLALTLGLIVYSLARYFARVDQVALDLTEQEVEFTTTTQTGWAIAICLSLAAISFIFSRFVAGMSKQEAWQNLRGGAGYMVGNAILLLAIAIGFIFKTFENEHVVRGVATGIPVFMGFVAGEILLNFILNLYRPRRPGETPRPAFDSRVLSLFAAPDNIVRTINDAVNYQFGFDITSSWGYQLLLRSAAWLLALGVVVLLALNTMVIVEPHQQAVKLANGRIIDDKVYGSGIMWKLPWPFQSAMVFDVNRVHELTLTAKRDPYKVPAPGGGEMELDFWQTEMQNEFGFEPFIVRTSRVDVRDASTSPNQAEPRRRVAVLQQQYALVDLEATLQYRIRPAAGDEQPLLDYLTFADDEQLRRTQGLTVRELAIRNLALREITQQLSAMELETLITTNRNDLAARLRGEIQRALDNRKAGVEVLELVITMLRPAGNAANEFYRTAEARQQREQRIIRARNAIDSGFTTTLGDLSIKDEVLAKIDEFNRLEAAGSDDAAALKEEIRTLLMAGGGAAAGIIARAEKDRWVQLISTRAQASRLQGEIKKFRAAPEVYQSRQVMQVIARTLADVRKYIIGIDPEQVSMDVELQELNPVLDFSSGEDDSTGAE
jgi:membrane protease subunit HflK